MNDTRTTRRALLRLGTSGLFAAAVGGLPASGQTPPRRRPNIILILADDLGVGDLGCYGQTKIQTPNLDRMAAEGVRFTQHYCGTSVCAPSRCALLTGKHTGHAAIRGNGKFALEDDPEDPSVFRWLKDAGYRTALIGKSGLSGNIEDGAHPNRKGVDHFFGFVSHSAAHRHYPESMFRNGEKVPYPGNRGKEGDAYNEAAFLEEAKRFLRDNKDRPFFLHYASTVPHADLAAPDEWRKRYAGKFPETPFAGGHYRAEPQPRATYAAMVSYLDWEVGQLLTTLKELGIERDTLVLFVSDNGPMREGGYSPEFFRSSGGLRGGKRDLYEGGVRSPLIARWPGRIKAGTTSDHVSAFWDFPATACALAGAPAPPKDTDGVSFAPALLGDAKGQNKHEYLYWEFHEQGGKRAVRVGDWKMVQVDAKKSPDGPVEVYDLRSDPAETRDLAARHPEKVAEARHLFAEAHVPRDGFTFGAAGATAAGVAAAPIRVLPLGDSITQGGRRDREEYTYRHPLFYRLREAGYPVDFIGSLKAGLHGDAKWPDKDGVPFDPDHEGHYGWKTAKVRDNLREWMKSYPAPPDVVLIHLGTNDQGSQDFDRDIVAPLREMVGMLRAANPRVVVLLGHLNFNGGAALQIRPKVEALAKELNTAGSPVATVAHYEGWTKKPDAPNPDTFDWAHPNPSGQKKMADGWFAAMKPHLDRLQKERGGK